MRYVIGLGANLGDRWAALREAVARLAAAGVVIEARSPVYETPPMHITEQPSFLNAAVRVATPLSPHELLELCLGVERAMGRVRTLRWGPRTIDIDLLWYDGPAVHAPDLTLPHPRLAERPFALVPLRDTAPEGAVIPPVPEPNDCVRVGDL